MMPLAKGKIFALGNAFGLLFPFGKTDAAYLGQVSNW